MPIRTPLLLALALLSSLAAPCAAPAQSPDSKETSGRGYFIGSRPPLPKSSAGRRSRPTARPKKSGPAATPPAGATAPGPLGIGYTLFKEVTGARPVRVSPDSVFREDDRIRIVVETNADGYVYLFGPGADAHIVMLFPDARLDKGENFVAAHQLIEIPSERSPDYQWFRFVGEAGSEDFYIVVSADPLPGVPIGDDLVRYCATVSCPFQPADQIASRIVRIARSNEQTNQGRSRPEPQTDEETAALSRGLVLSAGAAEPAVVAVNSDAAAGAVVVRLTLHHRQN